MKPTGDSSTAARSTHCMRRLPTRLATTLFWSFVACTAGYAEVPSHTAALAQIGRFEFSAQMAHPAQLPKDKSDRHRAEAGFGAAGAALGTSLAPVYGSALVIGGIILVPLGLMLAGSEHRTWQTMAQTVKAIDFTKATMDAMQRRAAHTLPVRSGKPARAEMVILAFGVTGSRPDRACFVADADFSVHLDDKEIIRARLHISDRDPSAGAPPAQCASLETFAAKDGRLLKDTAAEYAEVLAAMAIERIVHGAPR